jgi:hypothetical protein
MKYNLIGLISGFILGVLISFSYLLFLSNPKILDKETLEALVLLNLSFSYIGFLSGDVIKLKRF